MRTSTAICLLLLITLLSGDSAHAACAATTRTWTGATSANWNVTTNWGGDVPDTNIENASIVSATRIPNANFSTSISCLEVLSGQLNASTNGVTLSIVGDYFRALTTNALTFTAGRTFTINLAGTSSQDLSVVDPVNYVQITNNGTVNFTHAFQIRNALTFSGSGTTLNINDNLTLSAAGTVLTVPSGVTVNVGNGVVFTAAGGLTVNGTLNVSPGGKIFVGSGRTLTIGATGAISLSGASGNPATLEGNGGTFTFAMNGTLTANHFRINRMVAAGLNVAGTVNQLDNGEFHYIASAGRAITVGATAAFPATLDSIGFFNDGGFATVRNFSVNAGYVGNTVTVNNWSGLGGNANETADPNSKVNWGSQAGTELTLQNLTAGGNPPASINPSIGPSLFATFGFSLTNVDIATDITAITLTQYGTANASDIEYIQVFREPAGSKNCAYNAGVDLQVGSNLTLSGSPPTASISFSAADVQTTGASNACVHVLARTSATAQDNNTIGFRIAGTSDVTNAKSGGGSYSFSSASGPPISAGLATVNSVLSQWDGSTSTVWTLAGNWSPATLPSATRDCTVGSAVRIPALGGAQACRNATLQTGGTLDFGGTTNELQIYGALTVQSGFTFQSATSGSLRFAGSTTQSMQLETAFPGNVTIANSGGAIVGVDTNSTVNGNATVTQGTLRISDGVTLTVLGNLTVQTGATLEIAPGGILALADGKVLTVDLGGTLKMIGTAGNTSRITLSSGSSGYSVIVNGTIQAQYYLFEKMGLNGIRVNSGATIDASSFLQNGTYSYPMVASTTMLSLYRQVPGNALTSMVFDANGSSTTGVTNVLTNAGAGTLTISSYSGSWSGPTYDNDTGYLITWTGATNTIDLTQEATSPVSAYQGQTYTMGRFGFTQSQAGASYSDTDITSLVLTLTGTGSASDISQARIYYDSSCAGSGGTLLGSGTFSGSPAKITFSGLTGATIPASLTTPPKRCIYVQYDISGSATNANTVGVSIAAGTDVVNSQSYAISSGTPPPITLGTPSTIVGSSTTWTGATDTAWCTASNWNGGLPTSVLNCTISNVTNLPSITGLCGGSTIPTCNSLTINSGTLTLAAGTELRIYGGLTNNGTINQSTGTLRLMDDGATPSTQTVASGSAISALTFTKTAGGTVKTGSGSITIQTLTFPSGSNFTFLVPGSSTLTLPNGLTVGTSGVNFQVAGGGTVKMGASTTLSLTAGTVSVAGTNDAYPQTLTNKGKITNNGSGRWAFTTTGGTLSLTGFLLDNLDTSGLNIGGNTAVTALNGGQLSYLSTTYASVRGIQFNTTGSLPTTASNIGWNWSAPNSTYNAPPSPATTDAYLLASSSGCASQTVTFDQWFGDFFFGQNQPVTSTKVSATNCTLTIAAAASPVSISRFIADPYDSLVQIEWDTEREIEHRGFDLYRSASAIGGYTKLNSELIRNFESLPGSTGHYRFIDPTVQNGIRYFYRLEDIALNGARRFHGPVEATPQIGLGTPTPVPPRPVAPPTDEGALGKGIRIVSRTRHSLRLEIRTDAPTFDALGAPQLEGYAGTLEAGAPQLLERSVLIEADSDLTHARLESVNVDEVETNVGIPIPPAPYWAPQADGRLLPTRTRNAAKYSENSFSPKEFIHVREGLKAVGSRKYLLIDLTPLQYNPVAGVLKRATRVYANISFAQNAEPLPHPLDPALSPSAIEGNLRIRYRKTGMYELSFEDLAEAGVDAPFVDQPNATLRVLAHSIETPLQILSEDELFGPGDRIRFYLVNASTDDDLDSEAVLSLLPLESPPLRMREISASPGTAPPTDEKGTWRTVTAEKNERFVLDLPIGEGREHFYWSRVAQEGGSPSQPGSSFDLPIDLPHLQQFTPDLVTLKLTVRGRGGTSANPLHHVELRVNDVTSLAAQREFFSPVPTTLVFQLPAHLFKSGLNSIRVTALGDRIAVGDSDILDIDRLEVSYRAFRIAIAGQLSLENYRPDHRIEISGFGSPHLSLFDVTDPDRVAALRGFDLHFQGPSGFRAEFLASTGVEGLDGFRLIALEDSRYEKPLSLSLAYGYQPRLRMPDRRADLIVIGTQAMIDATEPLIEQRRREGLEVVTASLEQIYAEFSHGQRSSNALRELLTFASTEWRKPAPRYALIVGTATYDPNDYLGFGADPSRTPAVLAGGEYLDFETDDGLATASDLAVGRIPARTPNEAALYAEKIIRAEPSTSPATLIVDQDTLGEGFSALALELRNALLHASPGLPLHPIERGTGQIDAVLKQQIRAQFASGTSLLTYLGHGAENLWASPQFFSSTDALSLRNETLPWILSLSCLTAAFADPDPTKLSLGEALVMNPNGGASAFWGFTGMTSPIAQTRLARQAFELLDSLSAEERRHLRLGDLLLRIKIATGLDPALRDARRSAVLLGDPTLPLPEALQMKGSNESPVTAIDDGSNRSKSPGFACATLGEPPASGNGPSAGAGLEFALLCSVWLFAYLRGRKSASWLKNP